MGSDAYATEGIIIEYESEGKSLMDFIFVQLIGFYQEKGFQGGITTCRRTKLEKHVHNDHMYVTD